MDETLYDDVPDWLDQPLHDWLLTVLRAEGGEAEGLASRVLMRLRWTPQNGLRQSYTDRLVITSGIDLLTVVDALLQLHPGWNFRTANHAPTSFELRIRKLEEILADSGSLYRVDRQERRLVRRVDPTVQFAVDKAIATANPTVANHLREAWVAAYGLSPDPDKAYDQAVLAVEELTCPLVSPSNNRATLGTVARDLRNQLSQWELNIGDTGTGQPAAINTIIEMLDLLWKGQSRHGGNSNSRQQTRAEGEFAVHMAAVLTQWLSTGLLLRQP
jgi:hypothetical protein